MLMKNIVAGFGIAIFLAGFAHAEGGYYGGNISFLDYSEPEVDISASVTAITGRLGTHFNENVSGELRVGFGVDDDTVSFDGLEADLELESLYGVYIRGGIPVTENIYPYAILGYSRGELKATVAGFGSNSESETDTSFGLGVDVDVIQGVTINLEYMNYFDKDGVEVDSLSIGLAKTF